MANTSRNIPTADFTTSTLNGALTSGSTSATIGSGLGLAATNGILQLDYDSTVAVGVDTGPETIFYTAYNTSTGAVTGITRGINGTTAVAHINGASVQAGMSVGYLNNLSDIIAASAWTAWVPTVYKNNHTTALSPTGVLARYVQIGRTVICNLAIDSTGDPSSGGATNIYFTPPVAYKTSSSAQYFGTGRAFTTVNLVMWALADPSVASLVSLTLTGAGNFNTDNSIEITFMYESASA